jgi:transcriptional regulator with XRE-family HTH domain
VPPQQGSIDFNQRVGANLARLRKATALSQADLARELTLRGFPFQQQGILKVEKGSRPLKFEEALAMAAILGVDPAMLSDYSDEEEFADASAQLRNALAGIGSRRRQIAELEEEIRHYELLKHEAEWRLGRAGATRDSDGRYHRVVEDSAGKPVDGSPVTPDPRRSEAQ